MPVEGSILQVNVIMGIHGAFFYLEITQCKQHHSYQDMKSM